MKPFVTFKKRDYSIDCGVKTSVRIAVDSGGKPGTVFLKLTANVCTFDNGKAILETNFGKETTEVKFDVVINCSEKDVFYSRFFTWAVNPDGESPEDMATITIDCD
jgi:hypothetical protein